jgi:hypothetical protein
MEKSEEKVSMKERAKQIQEEMNSGDRKFSGLITLGDLDDAGVTIFDLFDMPKLKASKVKFTWDVLIRIANVKMVKGEDLTRDTPFMEGLAPIGEMLSKGFLGKGSES